VASSSKTLTGSEEDKIVTAVVSFMRVVTDAIAPSTALGTEME
jgi:hypothetical protein